MGEQTLQGPDLKAGISVDSLPSGEKILGHADGTPALLINQNNHFYAVGAICSHYSANLMDGILTEGTIHCPWHHSCFDLKTGDAQKAPALNPIPTWRTEVENGIVYAREKQEAPKAREGKVSKEHFVIVGSGAAGHAAAEMLRKEGFGGAITMLSSDIELPYDRPNLSKDYLAGTAPEEWMPLRPPEFYEEQKIKVRLKTKVTELKAQEKKLILEDGESLSFDKCLLAMGGSPVKPPIEGIEQPHVHFLRTFADCRSLIQSLSPSKKIVVVGAGFIGLEAAASLRMRGSDVTVVAPDSLPLARIVEKEVGELLKSVHEKNGVQFHLGHTVKKIEKDRVILENDESLKADVVLIGTGIKLNTSLAENASLRCDQGVLVDSFLKTSADDIYAAGDIARWPRNSSDKSARVEHWVVAQTQGQAAARNMLGQKQAYLDVPFFWSQQFDVTINYVGYAGPWTSHKIFGDVDKKNCAIAFYDGDKVGAILTIGRDQECLHLAQAMEKQDQKRIEGILVGGR